MGSSVNDVRINHRIIDCSVDQAIYPHLDRTLGIQTLLRTKMLKRTFSVLFIDPLIKPFISI